MSLFGDDDLPSRPKQSSSLFDDDPKPADRSGNSLFADDSLGDDSPWSFPTPKKAARGSLVKSLLPASDVPDSYIDAYDALLEQDGGAGNNVPYSVVQKLLGESGLPDEAQAKIVDIVSQPGQESAGLGRNEFNVLFALIGLAQEGEDITLDSVDERKRSEFRFPEVALPIARSLD
jgi:sorting nexin-8